MNDLVEKNYKSDTAGYEAAQFREQRKQINQYIANNVSQAPKINPNANKVPVIINDPFAISNSLGLAQNPALSANNVYVNNQAGLQPIYPNSGYQSPYGSLANSESQIITPNTLMQNSNTPIYQQPTFGSNNYRPRY
jgi:hypothetical protein